MRGSVLPYLALLFICPIAAQDFGEEEELLPIKISVVVDENNADQELIVNYLNFTREYKHIAEFEVIRPRTSSVAKANGDICNEIDSSMFIISLAQSKTIQVALQKAARLSKIPVIQLDFSVWYYRQLETDDSPLLEDMSIPEPEPDTQNDVAVDSTTNGTAKDMKTAKSMKTTAASSGATATEAPTMTISGGSGVNTTAPSRSKRQAKMELTTAVPDIEVLRSTNSSYFQLVPPTTVVLSMLKDLYLDENMTNPVILYDKQIKMSATNSYMINILNVTKTRIRMKDNATDIREQIQELKQRRFNTILMISNVKHAKDYLKAAKPEMERQTFKWLLFTTDVASLQTACDECTVLSNVFWINPTGTRTQDLDKFKVWLYRDKDETEIISTETELEAAFYFDMMNLALDYLNYVNQTTAAYPNYICANLTLFDNETLSLQQYLTENSMSNTYGAFAYDDNSQMYYQDVDIKIAKLEFTPENRETRKVGNWSAVDGIVKFFQGTLNVKLSDVKTYRVVILEQPPFIQYYFNETESRWTWRGYCIDLIAEIAEIVGFNYTFYEVKDGMYGSVDEHDEWNGLIKELVTGEAEIALAPLSVMAERENVVDFTVPYYDLVGTTILMKKHQQKYDLFKFLSVLEPPVWGCIVGAYFFTSFLLWIFDRFSPYSYTNNKEKYKDDPEKREFTLKECLWFCMTSLTPQGGGEAPKNISGRLVAATWWLFGFIIIASYTANLAAFLTVSRLETPISSLDDLAKQYKIQYAPVQGSASETYFRRMAQIEDRFYEIWKTMSLNDSMTPQERAQLAVWDYPVSDKYTTMWQYMQEAGLPKTTADAIERVQKSSENDKGFAFIGDATEIRYAEITHCDLKQVGSEFSRKPYAIAVQQLNELKDKISSAILQLLNQRKLETLKERWWNQNPDRKKNCPPSEEESDGISIENIGGVFIVILVGIALSIVTLAFEYWYYKDRRTGGPEKTDGNAAQENHEMDSRGFTTNADGLANGNGTLNNNDKELANGNGDGGHYNAGHDITS